jgi:predicted dehydrogenase
MKSNKTIDVLLIGLGNIGLGYDQSSSGEQIFTHAKACMVHDDFSLVAGVDLNEERCHAFEDFTGKKAYTSIESTGLLEGDIDLVIIATPTDVRKEIVDQSLKLKPKAILIEKPIASSVDEADEIIEACGQEEVFLFVNYFRFYDPKIQGLRVLIDELQMGEFCHSVCHYSNGLLNNASHYLSLLLQWFGAVERISIIRPSRILEQGDADVSFSVRFGKGDSLFFPVESEYDIGELDIFFERGRIRFDNYCENVVVYGLFQDPFFDGYKRLLPVENQPEQPGSLRYQWNVLNGLKTVFEEKGRVIVNTENALETIKICNRVLNEAKGSTCSA